MPPESTQARLGVSRSGRSSSLPLLGGARHGTEGDAAPLLTLKPFQHGRHCEFVSNLTTGVSRHEALTSVRALSEENQERCDTLKVDLVDLTQVEKDGSDAIIDVVLFEEVPETRRPVLLSERAGQPDGDALSGDFAKLVAKHSRPIRPGGAERKYHTTQSLCRMRLCPMRGRLLSRHSQGPAVRGGPCGPPLSVVATDQ
jgi:hypothetical protein